MPLALELAAARTQGALAGADPRALSRAARPVHGRPRRGSAAADPARDDRVVVRAARPRTSGRSSPGLPSFPAAAPSKRRRASATRGSTCCSRWSRRACCGEPSERYWMLETIREYASERLEASGEGEALRRRLAEWLLALAPVGELPRSSRKGDERHDLVVSELSNIRAAMTWAMPRIPSSAHGSLLALEQFWAFRSPFEARRWLDESARARTRSRTSCRRGCWPSRRADLARRRLRGGRAVTCGRRPSCSASSATSAASRSCSRVSPRTPTSPATERVRGRSARRRSGRSRDRLRETDRRGAADPRLSARCDDGRLARR